MDRTLGLLCFCFLATAGAIEFDAPPFIPTDDPGPLPVLAYGSLGSESSLGPETVQVQCMDDMLIVALDRKRLRRLGFGPDAHISFRDTSDMQCTSREFGSNRTHFKLTTFYSKCQTTRTIQKDTVTFHNQVVIRRGSSQDTPTSTVRSTDDQSAADPVTYSNPLVQEFNCRLYLNSTPAFAFTTPFLPQQTQESNLSYRFELFSQPWGGEPWGYGYPRDVLRQSTIYTRISFEDDPMDMDLRALVKDCYFSKTSDPLVTDPDSVYMLLANTCPYKGNSDTFWAESKSRAARFSKVAFKVSKIRYFGPLNHMFLHCRVTACSISGNREQQGYEKCPKRHHCSSQQFEDGLSSDHKTPVDPQYDFVSTGPLRPVIPDNPQPVTAPSCPPCLAKEPASDLSDVHPEPYTETVLVQGHSMATVVCIAIGSFLVGVLLVAGLWFTHDHTQPKKLSSKRRNESRDFAGSSTDSSLPLGTPGPAPSTVVTVVAVT